VWCFDEKNLTPSGVVKSFGLSDLLLSSNIICLSMSKIFITIINSVKIKKGDKAPFN
jgi:hypothetical protein